MYAEILPFTYTDSLTYFVPRSLETKIKIGQVVEIPLKGQKTKGIIFEFAKTKPNFKTRKILNITSLEPLLTPAQIELAKWLSLYYFSSLYQVLRNTMVEGIEKYASQKIKGGGSPSGSLKDGKKKIILYGNAKEGQYFKLAAPYLKKKKQVLILFSDNLALECFVKKHQTSLKTQETSVISSRLKKQERIKEWFKIKKNESSLIIGTRTALFSPFYNLGLIIIDKEYEDGFKQEKTPKYDSREIALFLQKITGCNLMLQTDIPTLENFYRVLTDYKIIKLKLRKIKRKIIISRNYSKSSILKDELERATKKKLREKKQVVLFLNRKGRNIFVLCPDCGDVTSCPNCEVSLVSTQGLLVCNHCGFKKIMPLICEKCGSVVIKRFGMGTEKLEEEIKSAFPLAKTLRIDETTKKTINKEEVKKADIIIGTQMVKSLDFQRVGLLVFFSVDNMLNLPTYKAPELAQKTLASFISKTPGDCEIIINTFNPEGSLMEAVAKQDYSPFFEQELNNLKNFRYPPFYDLIQVNFSGKDEDELKKKAEETKNYFRNYEVIGPFIPFIARRKGKSRLTLIIKVKKNTIFYDKIFKSKNISVIRNPEIIL